MDISEQKAQLRKLVGDRRDAAHAAAIGAGEAARDHFLVAGLQNGMRIVSAYRPIRSEIDPEPLMRALIALGCRLCLPVVEGKGKPLKFREWTPTTVLEDGPYGAEVPSSGDWLAPELLIVPLLAFDMTGARLGYGGGFYDRTIAQLSAAAPVRTVGFAYSAQQVDSVPIEATDRLLDAIVTENGVIPGAGTGADHGHPAQP